MKCLKYTREPPALWCFIKASASKVSKTTCQEAEYLQITFVSYSQSIRAVIDQIFYQNVCLK